jgi:hypothetical protein
VACRALPAIPDVPAHLDKLGALDLSRSDWACQRVVATVGALTS